MGSSPTAPTGNRRSEGVPASERLLEAVLVNPVSIRYRPVVATGHIRKRGNAWQLIVAAGRDPITGRKRYVSRTVHGAKREAQAQLNRLLVEVGDGAHQGTDATVGELLERWLAVASPDWSPKTVLETRRFLDRLILPRFGATPLRKLTTAALDQFYADLRKSGGVGDKPLAPASVRRVHVVVRRGLQQGVKWGWLSANPAANATLPRVPRVDIQPPAPDQVATLIRMAAEEEPEFAVFLRLAAATGARRGELCALRWSDIDLDAGTVVVARSIVQGGDGLVEKETKTHAIRRIALDRGTVVDLADHLYRSHELAGQFGVDFGDSGYVFSYQPDRSAPWRPDVATARFERLRDRAGLPTVRLHDLRHYVATRLIGAGVSVRTVSGRLGHANPATTLSVYSHFLQAADQQAAQMLGDLLDGPMNDPHVGA